MPLSCLTQAHGSSSTKIPEQMVVPTRPFGKTGANVSILSHLCRMNIFRSGYPNFFEQFFSRDSSGL